jgi:RIO kinase 1
MLTPQAKPKDPVAPRPVSWRGIGEPQALSPRLVSFHDSSLESHLSKEKSGSRLSVASFKRHQLAGFEQDEVQEAFGGRGLITNVLGVIGDGKEATVYCCEADPRAGVELLAAKVYRAQKFRAFERATLYAGERVVLDKRAGRAMKARSKTGRRMAHHAWIQWEWETLCRLHDAGASVPKPIARSDDAILMEYIGTDEGPAPQLRHVDLDLASAREVWERLLRDIEIFLDCHLVHGDLSAYNVLFDGSRPRVIDLPQSVDLHASHDGYERLRRDVRNLETYFARHSLSAGNFAERAWQRYRRGDLGR